MRTVPWGVHPEILGELECQLARLICTGDKTSGRFQIIKYYVSVVFQWDKETVFFLILCYPAM